jgi:hypothetical protein
LGGIYTQPRISKGAGWFSTRSTAIMSATIPSMWVRLVGLSILQPRLECLAIASAACRAIFGVLREGDALLDDRGVQPRARRDRAGVGHRERGDGQAFALELGGELAGPPHVERDLPERVPGGERPDVVGDLQHRLVAVVEPDADVQVLVDPHERRGGPLRGSCRATRARRP